MNLEQVARDTRSLTGSHYELRLPDRVMIWGSEPQEWIDTGQGLVHRNLLPIIKWEETSTGWTAKRYSYSVFQSTFI